MNPIALAMGWGFTAAMLPGPFQAYLIHKTLSTGWRRSIALVLVPLISDLPAILLTILLLNQLPSGLLRLIQIAGGLYVARIAFSAWKQFRAGAEISAEASRPAQERTFVSGLLMNVLNPSAYIFWGTVSGPLLLHELQRSFLDGLLFLVSFYGIVIMMDTGLVTVFTTVRRLNGQVTKLIAASTIVLLVSFSLTLMVQGIHG